MKVPHCLYRCIRVTVAIAVTAAAILLPAPAPILAAQSPIPHAIPPITKTDAATMSWRDDAVWARWSDEHYALVQEGDDLWIGTGNGVLRWHIPTQTSTRYSVIDGLPSHRIFAIALDAAGNRWFGGDGGLSRLDASGGWTHFTTANSGLHADYVDGIAVGVDGALWLSHHLPDGSVSHRTADGAWAWSPNRTTMVTQAYAAIVQTQNANPLWVVADGAVWVDFAVYDGSGWSDRTPVTAERAHPDVMAAWNNEVWALFVEGVIHHWTGAQWETLMPEPPVAPNGGFTLSTMTVTADGRLWVAGRVRTCIKGCAAAVTIFAVDRIAGAQHNRSAPDQQIDEVTSVKTLMPAGDGVWASGPAWLYSPGGDLYRIADTPVGDSFTSVIAGGDGLVWLSSISRRYSDVNAPAALQGLDDAATTVLHDDQWQIGRENYTASIAERTPAGDVWLTLVRFSIYGYLCPQSVTVRRHQDQWIEYTLPISGPTSTHCPAITDIFAQDEHNTWFVYVGPQQQDGTAESGVLHLNDGGTPAVLADDTWTTYPFPSLHMAAHVAVNDSIWLATREALYRWTDGEWRPVGDSITVRYFCDLAVAANGYLLAHRDVEGQCRLPAAQVGLMRPTASSIELQIFDSVERFLAERWDIARTVTHRNPLFTRDAFGAIWYFAANRLCRRTDATEPAQCIALPEPFTTLSQIEMDIHGHLWLAGDGALWRVSRMPSFALQANPPWLWMTPNSAKHSTLYVQPVEGFQGAVGLSIGALPDEFAATLSPAMVEVGEGAALAITTTASVALGDHLLTVQALAMGAGQPLTRTATITVRVAAEVHELHLPLTARQ